MAYNSWKLIDKIDVAVKTAPLDMSYRQFTGYIVEHGDKEALEKAKDWAREREYDREKQEYTKTYEPEVHTFENEGFTAKILDSAGGSSQGGRLSFWRCEIEKDGVKFTIGVNDAILADLIKNSDISNGEIKQKVMFARKSGQSGLIHEKMDAYTEALADMKQKADLKTAKKTNKWEIGGVYSTLTQTDICLGEVWDTMEKVEDHETYGWHRRMKLVKRETPIKLIAWTSFYSHRYKDGMPKDFTEFLTNELKDRDYVYLDVGKPPARAKAQQLEVKDSAMKLIDKMLSLREEYHGYGEERVKGRYVRVI